MVYRKLCHRNFDILFVAVKKNYVFLYVKDTTFQFFKYIFVHIKHYYIILTRIFAYAIYALIDFWQISHTDMLRTTLHAKKLIYFRSTALMFLRCFWLLVHELENFSEVRWSTTERRTCSLRLRPHESLYI